MTSKEKHGQRCLAKNNWAVVTVLAVNYFEDGQQHEYEIIYYEVF